MYCRQYRIQWYYKQICFDIKPYCKDLVKSVEMCDSSHIVEQVIRYQFQRNELQSGGRPDIHLNGKSKSMSEAVC